MHSTLTLTTETFRGSDISSVTTMPSKLKTYVSDFAA